MNPGYIRSQTGTLHIASIIAAVVVLVCISVSNSRYYGQYIAGYGFAYFTAVFALVFSIVSLVLYALGVVTAQGLNQIPWNTLVAILAVIVGICFIACGGIATDHSARYYHWNCRGGGCHIHPAIAAFCFFGGLVNLFLAYLMWRGG